MNNILFNIYSFSKIDKTSRESDYINININIKTKDKNIDVKLTGKGLLAAGVVAVAPTAICALGATVAVCAITKAISKRKKAKGERFR